MKKHNNLYYVSIILMMLITFQPLHGQCISSPTLIKSYTTSASGLGVAGLPSVTFDVPQTGTGKRFLMLFITFERDATPLPYGDNNESVLTGTIGDNITLMPIVKYGGVKMTNGTFLSSDTKYNESSTFTLCNYVYFLPESSLSNISNNTIDLTSFNLPKNVGDDVKITIALFDYVKGMDSTKYGSYNFYDVGYVNSASFTEDNLTTYTKTISMLSSNQPAGVTQNKNTLLVYAANSSDTRLDLTTTNWNTIEKSSVYNTNGTYTADPNRIVGTSENDGITTGLFSLTGVTGSQTISLTTNPSKKTMGGMLIMRLYGDSYTAPVVKSSLLNSCPSLSVNLNDAHISTIPTGAELRWYTNNSHTGTALTSSQIASAGTGVYYAFYYSLSCWSIASTAVSVTTTVCHCYKPAAIGGTTSPTKHGITALGRAGAENGNWPMVRNGAWTVLESKTKGFVMNRIPTTFAVVALPNPVEGMMVYDEEEDCLKINIDGTSKGWKCFNTQTCP